MMGEKKSNRILPRLAVSCMALLGASCAAPLATERDFGASVRRMVAEQIHDPAAAAHPDPGAPVGMDAAKAAADLKTLYRQSSEGDVAKSKESGLKGQ
jgi:hypothetical protein